MWDKLRHLQSAIANYDQNNSLVPQEELVNEMKDTKLALDIYSLYDAQGAQTRARIKWIENGERNNKYFLQLEKCNFNKKFMTSLKDKHGQLHTTHKKDYGNTGRFLPESLQRKGKLLRAPWRFQKIS